MRRVLDWYARTRRAWLSAPAPPFWFVACVAIVAGVALRVYVPAPANGTRYAFWGFLFGLAKLIWTGIETAREIFMGVAGKVGRALLFLNDQIKSAGKWAAQAIANAGVGLKDAAKAFRSLYTGVLRPAFDTIHNLLKSGYEWLRDWFATWTYYLNLLRTRILDLYDKFVFPVVHTIDVTRRIFRTLAALGWKRARTIDQRLGALESKIQQPFFIALAKINESLNWINRIVTLDGLIQKLTLFKSLFAYTREYKNFTVKSYMRTTNAADDAQLNAAFPIPNQAARVDELDRFVTGRESRIGVLSSAWGESLYNSMRR